jgi:hypothetical protein
VGRKNLHFTIQKSIYGEILSDKIENTTGTPLGQMIIKPFYTKQDEKHLALRC